MPMGLRAPDASRNGIALRFRNPWFVYGRVGKTQVYRPGTVLHEL